MAYRRSRMPCGGLISRPENIQAVERRRKDGTMFVSCVHESLVQYVAAIESLYHVSGFVVFPAHPSPIFLVIVLHPDREFVQGKDAVSYIAISIENKS